MRTDRLDHESFGTPPATDDARSKARPAAGRPPLAFDEALDVLRGRQKPGPGVPAYTRWVNRGLARYAAAAAYRSGLGPNEVTAISGLVSLAGMAVLVLRPASLPAGVAVAMLLATGYLLDSADGQVARLSGRSSRAGEWLDHVVDAVRMPMLHLCTLVALFQTGTAPWVLVLPLLYAVVTTGQFFSQMLAEQLAPSGTAPIPRQGQSFFLLPTDTGVLCWLYVLWGLPGAFVPAYAALLVLNLVHSVISMRRRFRQLSDPDERTLR
ncbi:CDP-alcohol phosphatidyltransferase family protein [Ruania halotolerans]|uniref:CDP-alcohol phosphatidyltransferase family protein n=1 Tax=Ruania halotolerans TaxID=2897773 RepID=UPI001E3D2478|nr:CDP-alcohol phosphatidyltransferase family protein [Ruania halotolerans]UFU05729.1 CDP-alcohol phosphatidyltransferase family protein [Ruania halotolerans]